VKQARRQHVAFPFLKSRKLNSKTNTGHQLYKNMSAKLVECMHIIFLWRGGANPLTQYYEVLRGDLAVKDSCSSLVCVVRVNIKRRDAHKNI